jgi:hypothetical protein
MNIKLENRIQGLQKIAEQYGKQNLIKITSDKIIVNVNDRQLWGTVFYLSLLILTPAGLLIYYLMYDSASTAIFLLLLVLVIYMRELNKILQGDNILIINLKERIFEVQNINALFKNFYPKLKVPFSDLIKSTIEEKSIYTKYQRIKWFELKVYDKRTNSIVLSSFEDKFPLPKICEGVKQIVDSILKEHKEYEQEAAANNGFKL